jgi:hypothetical protein
LFVASKSWKNTEEEEYKFYSTKWHISSYKHEEYELILSKNAHFDFKRVAIEFGFLWRYNYEALNSDEIV